MGHDTEIFSPPPPEWFICAICIGVFQDAVSMEGCGHTFCKECANDCLQMGSCPNCRGNVTKWNPNFPLRDFIETLNVHCSHGNSDEGQANRRRRGNDGEIIIDDRCNWIGPLKDSKTHENACAFKIISCPREDCNHECCKKDMHVHLEFHSQKDSIKANYERQIAEMNEKMSETVTGKDNEMQSIKAARDRY